MKVYQKHPDENEVWEFDFEDRIGARTVSSAAITAPSGITVGSPTTGSDYVRARISGGTDGETYYIKCAATLSDSDVVIGELNIEVKVCQVT